MGRITGLGGPFIKAKDPKALADWYQQTLGLSFNGSTYVELPFQAAGYNILSFFKEDNQYFSPSTKEVMINLRVEGFSELLEELKAKGVELVGDPLEEEYGKFAWIMDPEGHKIELWEPPTT
jgi:predicted enzyme related to lactoylglutathione lyase